MKYIYTPEEALSIADTLLRFLREQKFIVAVEQILHEDAPCNTTLLARKGHLNILLEAQNEACCDSSLKELALWLHNKRVCAELFIATHRTASFSGQFFKDLDQSGIGLILVEDTGNLKIDRHPQNPALIVCPDPTLKFASYKSKVNQCVAKFNLPHSFLTPGNPRMDAARDMCELVEGLTEEVALTGTRKNFIKLTEKNVKDQDWSSQINTLASQRACVSDRNPIIDTTLKTDLHSFRSVRNLLDHKVSTKRKEVERQQQLAERMMMGPRLVATLTAIKQRL